MPEGTSATPHLLPAAPDVVAARAAWLEALAVEKGRSAHTVAAYERDTRQFLVFLARHLGGPPDLAGARALPGGRCAPSSRSPAGGGRRAIPRPQPLPACRAIFTTLAKHHGIDGRAGAGRRAPQRKEPRLPRSAPGPLARGPGPKGAPIFFLLIWGGAWPGAGPKAGLGWRRPKTPHTRRSVLAPSSTGGGPFSPGSFPARGDRGPSGLPAVMSPPLGAAPLSVAVRAKGAGRGSDRFRCWPAVAASSRRYRRRMAFALDTGPFFRRRDGRRPVAVHRPGAPWSRWPPSPSACRMARRSTAGKRPAFAHALSSRPISLTYFGNL